MEFVSWCEEDFDNARAILFERWEQHEEVREVEQLKAMGALITGESDSVSAMKYKMSRADRATRMDTAFCKDRDLSEKRKNTRHQMVVLSSLLHARE